jgi:hypothetical protein
VRTRYWFDTEFMEDGKTIELLSIGVVCEDGREFYAESRDADWEHANDWVRENVLPSLEAHDGLTRAQIAIDLLTFVNAGDSKPEFWAYYGDYDWVVLCQLYGRMIDLPKGWPMFAMDVKQLCVSLGDPRLPDQDSTEHHALADARWTRLAWEFLRQTKVVLSVEEANGLADALEEYMRLDLGDEGHNTYKKLWNAADKALVPLRGGPYSMENRGTEPAKGPPSWRNL